MAFIYENKNDRNRKVLISLIVSISLDVKCNKNKWTGSPIIRMKILTMSN